MALGHWRGVHPATKRPSARPPQARSLITALLLFNIVLALVVVSLWYLGVLPRGLGAHAILVMALVDAGILWFWVGS